MLKREQWIWLPKQEYPNEQACRFGVSDDKNDYCVVSCKRAYSFKKAIKKIKLRFSGDTFFRLFCNGKYLATGPNSVGGDFLETVLPRPNYYATELEVADDEGFRNGKVNFYAIIRKSPVFICEFSKGHGGFFLQGEVLFEDGTKEYIVSDESWLIRKENSYITPCVYNENQEDYKYTNAERIPNRWLTETAPIPPRTEKEILPVNGKRILLFGNETKDVVLEFDKIYAGYIYVKSKKQGKIDISLSYYEREECIGNEKLSLNGGEIYRGIDFHSMGKIIARLKNIAAFETIVEISFLATYYPVEVQAKTITSDSDLNKVLEVCAHSLQYCRQTHHLDSPKHCEPLACTGDYYIETLMTAFSFGDLRLSAFDVQRTAESIRYQDGRLFHTSYSLIWVLMLWDVYLYTGSKELLLDSEEALQALLTRFETYLGENGLIENPPDYMFVDWLYPDGISLHHPPKALGQTCLNMFYYGALQAAEKIYDEIGEEAQGKVCNAKKENLRKAIIDLLFDSDKGLFFEGLNTPTAEKLLRHFMPKNVEKRYYRKHANILAAYFGLFKKRQNIAILEKVMSDEKLGTVQPYFMHFLLEAIYRNGLRDKYTINILEEWKAPIKEFSKGLPEGFYKPNEEYKFDYSHAWGGSPLYALPLALTGFEILKPNFQEIRLSPSLLGLQYAKVEIPTPYGMIEVIQEKGHAPIIKAPEKVKIHY